MSFGAGAGSNPRSSLRAGLAAMLAAALLASLGCGGSKVNGSAPSAPAFEAPKTYDATPPAAGSKVDAGKLSLFVEPEAGATPILDAINGAKKTVDVQVYLLSNKTLMDALMAAAKRGVKVRVMLEPNIFKPPGSAPGPNQNKEAMSYMANSGIQLAWADARFALTHTKMMVVDGRLAYICNSNWSNSSFVDRRDYNVITRVVGEAEELQKLFNADWNHKSYAPGAAAGRLVMSPINSRAKIKDLISRAKTSLKVEMEVIKDEEIVELLAAKDKAGVKVQVIMPDHQAEMAKALVAKGIADVKVIANPVMHAKLILRDGVEAYTGSVNLSTYSMDKNREIGIIQAEASLIKTLDATFDADHAKAAPPPAEPTLAIGLHDPERKDPALQ